ncbi:hypothetical protein M9H77_21485 [Catharanthus roseus]|uniref:Uncharacterized protein n=1 Tax=Catharanthus roseus TaxID=4058 RepID=A0ACC0AQ92_CATRO|nr:hypothetical protein M9H77_21485 [Catharanthus roseus]
MLGAYGVGRYSSSISGIRVSSFFLSQAPLTPAFPEDKFIWPFSKNGIYIVKSGYKARMSSMSASSRSDSLSSANQEAKIWNSIYRLPVQPKVSSHRLWLPLKSGTLKVNTDVNVAEGRIVISVIVPNHLGMEPPSSPGVLRTLRYMFFVLHGTRSTQQGEEEKSKVAAEGRGRGREEEKEGRRIAREEEKECKSCGRKKEESKAAAEYFILFFNKKKEEEDAKCASDALILVAFRLLLSASFHGEITKFHQGFFLCGLSCFSPLLLDLFQLIGDPQPLESYLYLIIVRKTRVVVKSMLPVYTSRRPYG